MTPQPTNEGGSEARFEAWNEPSCTTLTNYELACAKSAWNAQELYWSKRCEAMEKALKFFADFNNYVYPSGMSPADKTPLVLRDGRIIAQKALQALDALKEKGEK